MTDMTLYLLIALAPLAGCLLAGLFGNQIGRKGAHTATILGVGVSAVLSAQVLWASSTVRAPSLTKMSIPGSPWAAQTFLSAFWWTVSLP